MGLVQISEPYDFTMEQFEALPDDGRRHELVDGMLLVTPAPKPIHQTAGFELAHRLRLCCPRSLKVFVAPVDFRPTSQRSLQPDVLVCHRKDIGPDYIERTLLLAVEVISPSSRMADLRLKRGVYEEAGVTSYWIFDPVREVLTVLELSDGRYAERAVVTGKKIFDAALPFPVRIVPAELLD
jgi:Uma2 family endonuclease